MTSRMSSLNAMCFQYVLLCLDGSHSLNYKISPVKNCRVEVIRSNYSMHSFPITTLKHDPNIVPLNDAHLSYNSVAESPQQTALGKILREARGKNPFLCLSQVLKVTQVS